ncbi:HEAT repeat domain-containing protein [Cumulibacter manganitolerans]|uniref:HEAT repeat domain-containing protein n=1 Tax=Cumulibacter manganitolerans TaxID=1884992 RepID=UPI0012952846|nr:HEAT repeat domain-containing protein [Cumulibacter manganitolerans]
MSQDHPTGTAERLRRAFTAPSSSTRLRAALTAGSTPSSHYIDVLVEQCRTEPDFYVRDMLTWALIRHDSEAVIERLRPELRSDVAQGRSQALHTLSKIGDPVIWPAITRAHLQDDDDEVARAAWRTAVGLVPDDQEGELAEVLATQLARGGPDVQRSLSRALAALGDAARPVVERAKASRTGNVRVHAIATERLMDDPDEGFDAAIAEARRAVALLDAPGLER